MMAIDDDEENLILGSNTLDYHDNSYKINRLDDMTSEGQIRKDELAV